MASGSPVIVDKLVSAEKVADLLAFEAEYPELDYKRHSTSLRPVTWSS